MSRFLIPGAIFLALAGVLYVGVVNSPNKSTMQSALLGKPVPAFSLPVLGGTELLTNAQLAGRPWVLNVWGTWCAECRAEHATLLQIRQEGKVLMVGLNYKDEDSAARDWLTKLGNPYEVIAADHEGRAAIDWGVYGAPETFLVNPAGTHVHKVVGQVTAENWRTQFLPLIEGSAK